MKKIMIRYVIKRLLSVILIILGGAFVAFTFLYLVPGGNGLDVARLILGTSASQEQLVEKAHLLGVDEAYFVQLGKYFFNTFLRFDFGTSWRDGSSVIQSIGQRAGHTLIVGGFGLILNVIVGTALGIFAATHEGKWQDSLTMIIAMVFVSAPGFWVALMCINLFSVQLGWLSPIFVEGDWTSYIMPTVTGALGGIAINARQSRSAMLEVIRADYVTTARSKGQIERKVVWKHMLPNAMMPIITGVGGGLAMIVAGSPVMELLFSIPGIGAYMLSGINGRDRPVVVGCVIFFALFTGVVMILTDLAYAFLDPRIKAQYASGRRKK